MSNTLYLADGVFDGTTIRPGVGLPIAEARVAERSDGFSREYLGPGLLVPGFVDLQLNGGDGILLNDQPTVVGIARICAAHARLGALHVLPTLITDTPEVTLRALDAGTQASGIPGFLGLHLEGPHLALARKGAHDGALIRQMTEADLALYLQMVPLLPTLKITVAPESVTPDQVQRMVAAGILVSLGHSDADFNACQAMFAAGATCTTHLFNAMSQMQARAPGLVGAALETGRVSAGLIADGHHVSAQMIRIAQRAKAGPGALFLVSDAMAVAGTDLARFALNGREILRQDGRLTLRDGTLAGADLSLPQAVRFLIETVGTTPEQALAMASSLPAQVIGRKADLGHLRPGASADFLWLSPDWELRGVWRAGMRLL